MEREWEHKKASPQKFRKQFPEFSYIVQDLLWQRGLRTQKDIDEFFNPDYETDIHDPLLLKDIKKGIARVRKAVKKKESIVVYGDYDVDGVCATTLLIDTLKKLGGSVGVYIPDRSKEGHGLNIAAIDSFIKQKIDLLITVDCGITSIDEVAYAQKNGIDVIITDHHQVISKNTALAVIDPHQKEDKYPFKDLCGTAIAFKFSIALLRSARKDGWLKDKGLHKEWEKWFLDLVALATVSDVMPLLGENRTLLTYGLYVLAHQKRVGIRELMKVAKVSPAYSAAPCSTNLTPRTIGFILGPRINSAGRIDHANTAFALLNAKDQAEGKKFAEKLEATNTKRQRIIEKIMRELKDKGEEFQDAPAIVVGSRKWPIGVLGIVAGRLSDKYWKPAFVYEIQNEIIVGSARTIPGFNIVRALTAAKKHLLKFGGHPAAAGFTAAIYDEDKFKKALLNYAGTIFKKGVPPRVFLIDARVSSEDFTWKTFDDLERFAPFGEANPKPIFSLDNLTIQSIRSIGNGKKHFLMRLTNKEGSMWKALFFGGVESHSHLKAGDMISVAFEFDVDEWNGRRDLMLKIADIK